MAEAGAVSERRNVSARLKNRQRGIPFGFRFFQPEINWRAPRSASIDAIVRALITARQGNPVATRKHNWSLDYNRVTDEVDEFNAKLCMAHGWLGYVNVAQAPTLPKAVPPNQGRAIQSLKDAAGRAKELIAGAKTLMEWDESGDPPVAKELSERRAIICSTCPLNDPEDLTKWFTMPAAELIKRRVEKAQARNLTTPRDDMLNLCTACHCPLKLKVHIPIEWIVLRMNPAQMAKLKAAPTCWIVAESERA
jgi:hypothetical protein